MYGSSAVWGVDALVGEQTRDHKDIGLLVSIDDVDRFVPALGREWEFFEDRRPTQVKLRHSAGLSVTLDLAAFDGEDGVTRALSPGIRALAGGRGAAILLP